MDNLNLHQTMLSKSLFKVVTEAEEKLTKYKTSEVIKMLEDNNNLVFKSIGYINETILKFNGCIRFYDSNNKNVQRHGISNCMWELVQESVTFQEVLNSNKLCRVEHELINEPLKENCYCGEKLISEEYDKFKRGKYIEFGLLFMVLSWILSDEDLKEVIKNGKWYLEP